MIKVLLKKQLTEIFKNYFFDMKKNKARSKVSTVLYFVLFAFLMIFVMGATFGALSFALSPIITLGFGWLYYAVLSLIAVLFGVFGSVFSTYSGLYLSKDNDLLLSMPIPVSAIMTSRLLGVYLMGLLYSSVVLIPAVAVYFITAPFKIGAFEISGAVILLITVSLFVLSLSCIFGYLVARVSLRLKNKSFVTVIIALVFFALYYFVYFKASSFISEFIKNVVIYGDAIKQRAYVTYIIGRSAEGDILSTLAVISAVLLLLFVTLYIISKSFIKIATSTAAVKKTAYKKEKQRSHTILTAVLLKEAGRFTSSANYMLNCGLGAVFMIAAGVFVLFKGAVIREILSIQFAGLEGLLYVAACAVLFFMISMNDISAPSVSLEGKTLWQIRALPVPTKTVLKAKLLLQIYVNIVPALFCAVCIIITLRPDVITGVMTVLLCSCYVVFHSLFSLFCGLHKVNLNWTNEIVPIKQGLNVLFAVFGGLGFSIVTGLSYLLLAAFISAWMYMLIIFALLLVLCVLLYRFISNKGVRIFEDL